MAIDDSKREDIPFDIAFKHLMKYRDRIGNPILRVLTEYAETERLIEPLISYFTEAETEHLFMMIDNSDKLTDLQKVETIGGLLKFFEGSFPNDDILGYMKKVFGAELVQNIEQKREEVKKLFSNKSVEEIEQILKQYNKIFGKKSIEEIEQMLEETNNTQT